MTAWTFAKTALVATGSPTMPTMDSVAYSLAAPLWILITNSAWVVRVHRLISSIFDQSISAQGESTCEYSQCDVPGECVGAFVSKNSTQTQLECLVSALQCLVWYSSTYNTGWPFSLCKISRWLQKKKFRFGLARPKWNFSFKVNRSFWTSSMVTL